MEYHITIITIVLIFAGLANAQIDYGNGLLYKEYATADVYLESSGINFNLYDYLIVSKHPDFVKKRFLVEFNVPNITSTCNVQFAKMYISFWYAHKASFYTVEQVPYLSRQLQVHQVLEQWSETQATSNNRLSATPWNTPYLAINGTDASPYVQDSVGIFTGRPAGYVEFDVTEAVRNWLDGEPNYGLLVWDTIESAYGRDIIFYSREQSDVNRRPFLNVFCRYSTC